MVSAVGVAAAQRNVGGSSPAKSIRFIALDLTKSLLRDMF